MEHNFIPCSKWIKRGVAKAKPEVVQLSKDELKGLVDKAKSDILGFAGSVKNADKTDVPQNTDEDQFGMEDYDKDDEIEDLAGIGGLISLDDEDLDTEEQEGEENDSDKEDDEIKPNDNLIAVGHVTGDISVLEVYVYNEEDNDLYVHHDIVLPTVPLALEWLSNIPGSPSSGNYLAMGGMTPEITIWNLDLVNILEPTVKLGRFSRRKKDRHRNHGHRDAVLDLAWNTKMPHILASGSVDRTVLLWDLATAKAATQFKDFEEKVQTLQWHPTEVNILMAGSCDCKLRLMDCRLEEVLITATVDGEVEKTAWHPTNQFHALVGTSNGTLCAVDCRNGSVVWQVKAHNKEITGLVVVGGDSITTCSTDETVKVWSLLESNPHLKQTKQTNMGELHCLSLCPDNPNIICIGGSKKSCNFKVINLSTDMQPDADDGDMDVEGDANIDDGT
ncbi:periodic tryptophan protein 1 homolog [Macrosteles quadrilineatus]|uniref:periodic tryptophan protein 1 homolog n=1 Tax=Macrosteles quadrilineatus TaxID=74068 RepID=UPI0023E18AA6|nr:periodic tryptophan protein 1 homolog [Macrosteles quadrilineatus]